MPSFLDHNTQTFYQNSLHPIVATSATTVNLWDGMNMIGGAATLASLTVLMPSAPVAGEVVTIYPTVAVTALTMKDAVGGAVAGSPTALVSGTAVRMIWANNVWSKLS